MTVPQVDIIAELGEPREILEALTPDEAARLLAHFRTAKATQAASLDAAIAATLDALPRLVRLPARKILFGK